MKNILLIIALIGVILASLPSYAQTTSGTLQSEREILLEIVKQQTKLSEQQAITSTKVDSLEKSVKERLDLQANFMIALMAFIGVLTAGMFSFIGFILWDRKTTNAPIKTKVTALQKEVKELKERETKMELYIKQISQIDNRFAPFN